MLPRSPKAVKTAILTATTFAVAIAATTARGGSVATSINLYAPFSPAGIAAGIRRRKKRVGLLLDALARRPAERRVSLLCWQLHSRPLFLERDRFIELRALPLYLPASKVLRINLTKRLPSNPARGNPTRFPPWAIQLASGRWCELITGATGVVAGMRISYGCTGGGVLLGAPRRSSPTWTIFYAKGATAREFRAVSIRSAWW
jgi:hypothetical protein